MEAFVPFLSNALTRFDFKSYCRIHDLSILSSQEKKSFGLSPQMSHTSCEVVIRLCLCSSVSIFDTKQHLGHVQMNMQKAHRFSYLSQLDLAIFENKIFTFSMISSISVVFGHPDLRSPLSDSLPCLNSRLQHFSVANKGADSPYATNHFCSSL